MVHTIYLAAWGIHDFFNTLLIFITYYFLLPKNHTKYDGIISMIISFCFVFFDAFIYNYSTIAAIIVIPFVLLLKKSTYKLTIRLSACVFSLFITTFTQGIASVLMLDFFPNLKSPQTINESMFLFLSLTILNYSLTFMVLFFNRFIHKKYISSPIFNELIFEKVTLFSLVVFASSYFILDNLTQFINVQNEYLQTTILILSLIIVLVGISMPIFIYSYIKELKTNFKIEQMNERNAYITELEKNNDKLHKFKHDYKNLLLALSTSLNDKEDLKSIIPELMNYDDINLNSEINNSNLYSISDKLVRGILITKIMYAKDNGINVNYEIDNNIKIPHQYSVNLTRILGILLDNSIEAALKTKAPELKFAIVVFDGYLEFIIKNNLNSSQSININDIYQSGYTTKKNHSGLGLATVKEIVDSNDDLLLQTKIKDDHYSTILTVLEDK